MVDQAIFKSPKSVNYHLRRTVNWPEDIRDWLMDIAWNHNLTYRLVSGHVWIQDVPTRSILVKSPVLTVLPLMIYALYHFRGVDTFSLLELQQI